MLKLSITDPAWAEPITHVVREVKEVKSYRYKETPNDPKRVAMGAESVLRNVVTERYLLIRFLDGGRERFKLWGEQGYSVEVHRGDPEEFDDYSYAESQMCTDPNWMND